MNFYCLSRTIRYVYLLERIFIKLIFTSNEVLIQQIYYVVIFYASYLLFKHLRVALISDSKIIYISFPYRFPYS